MFETLYHKGKAGTLYQWDIEVQGDEIVTTYGLVDGQKQEARKRAFPKNIGKKNETSAEQQALAQAKSMHKFKLDRKYSLSPDEAEELLELPMLAKPIEKVKKITYPLDLQPKLDGVRCLAKWDGDEVVLMSRSGKPYDVPHISRSLESFLPRGTKLDGEIYVHGMTFQEVLTLAKKNREESIELEFHVYDCPIEDHEDRPWSERYMNLCETFGLATDMEKIKLVPTWTVNNKEELDETYLRCIEDGYEGAIARLHHGKYLYGYRSSELLKIKDFQDGEWPIVDAYEGEGKFEGCVTWVCEMEDGATFGVCPKGSLEEKKAWWELWLLDPSQIKDRPYKVQHFGFTDEGLPRFPIGLGFRDQIDISNPENGEDIVD
jgi:ATP-dependent DNA ligase